MLKPIWKSKQLGLETKLRLYNSNVLSVLLYSSECWKLTAKLAHKLETFQNRCLRKILGVFWPNTFTNEELPRKTDATSLAKQIKKRRWRWAWTRVPNVTWRTAQDSRTLDRRW